MRVNSSNPPWRGMLLGILALVVVGSPRALADVSAVGDVSPVVPDVGGDVGSLLTIGDTGVGGLFMDAAPPLSGLLEVLMSTDGIIGNETESIGAAVFDDFGVAWQLSGDLTVGLEGQGFLDVFDSASIEVDGKTTVGTEDTGQGVITLNGVASRLVTDDLTVGDDGVGRIDVLARGALQSGNISIIGDQDESDGTVRVSGLGSRWLVGDASTPTAATRLTLDDNTTGGTGKLLIDDQGLVQSSGSIAVNARGRIELGGVRSGAYVNGGTLRLASLISTVTNNGLIVGDGYIDGTVTNLASGELRNAATTVGDREYLRISGPVISDGTIESMGGEMEFESTVVNSREIIARDAIMRFNAGLTNTGTISIGGDTTLHGTIINTGGSVFVLSDSESLLVGDLTFSGSTLLALSVGPAAGTLDVTGTADLTGALLSLDYSAGIASQPGDSYQIFQADDGIAGAFPVVAAADGRLWDIDLVGTDTLIATATALVATPMGADFDGDGIVNGIDLAIWEANFGSTGTPPPPLPGDADGDGDVDGADLLQILGDFGGPPSLAAASTAAVPEPAALLLTLVGICCCGSLRRVTG